MSHSEAEEMSPDDESEETSEAFETKNGKREVFFPSIFRLETFFEVEK